MKKRLSWPYSANYHCFTKISSLLWILWRRWRFNLVGTCQKSISAERAKKNIRRGIQQETSLVRTSWSRRKIFHVQQPFASIFTEEATARWVAAISFHRCDHLKSGKSKVKLIDQRYFWWNLIQSWKERKESLIAWWLMGKNQNRKRSSVVHWFRCFDAHDFSWLPLFPFYTYFSFQSYFGWWVWSRGS